jgi:drug/metabolite transporter (DMT)-like permease
MKKNFGSLYFQVVFATAVWGAAYPFTKHLVGEISALSIMFLRAVIGLPILFALARPRFTAADFRFPALWRLGVMSVLGVSAQQFLQAYALKYTLATNAGWLIATTPLMVAALAVLAGEKVGLSRALAFGAGTAGTLLVVLSRGASLSLPSTRGDLVFLSTCLAWAFYVLCTRKWLTAWPTAKVTTATMLAAFVTVLPAWLAAGGPAEFGNLSARGWGDLAYLGVLSSGLAYLFWNNAVDGLGAVRTSYFIYIEPFATLFMAYLLLGETASSAVFAGGLLILAGVYLLGLKERRSAAEGTHA